jgi:high-affinity iron transporter
MAALSVVLAGNGVAALQEAGWISVMPVPFFTFKWLGIHPNVQCLGVQAVLIAVIVLLWRATRKPEAAAARVMP